MLDTYELRDSILMLKRKLEDMEMELNNIYKNICLLYNRLASEYENLIIEHGGEVPESVAPKIKKIYSIGEMLNTFQTISEIRKGNYGSPEDWD